MQEFFRLLNNYYDKVYVLSVQPAADRRKEFEQRFTGLNYSFFYGAYKGSFDYEEVKAEGVFNEELARKHHRYNKTMNAGEVGCSWSHRMIYEDMLANNYKQILILEDDAVPDPQTLKNVPDILNEMPADCELMMWGWDKNGEINLTAQSKKLYYHVQHLLGKLKWDHSTINNLFAKSFTKHIKKAGFHDHTYAYAVSRSGAEKLISLQTPIQYIADNLLAHACVKNIVKGYIIYPPVFLHDTLPDGTPRDSYIRE